MIAGTTTSAGSSTAAGSSSGGSEGEGGGPDGGAAVWCPPGPFGNPTLAGATPTRVAGVPPSDSFNDNRVDFTTVEGPVWIGDALYMSEFGSATNPPPSRILKLAPPSTVTIAIPNAGSNGLAVDLTGTLWGGVHADGSVSRFNLSSGARTAVASLYIGSRFNSPNDLAVRSDGNVYFSDPDYQAPTPTPQAQTRVYRIAPTTDAVTVVDAALTEPNGVTLSLDENTLYVSSTHGVFAFPVMADGSTGAEPATPLIATNIDGMVIDCAGNIYAAEVGSGNIRVYSPEGTELAGSPIVVTGVSSVTNTAFGGADQKTLFISAQGSGGEQGLFQVALNVPGRPY